MGDDTRTEGIDIDLSNATQEQLKKITETSDEDLQAQFDNKEPIIGGEKTPVVEKEGEEPPAPAPKAVKKTKRYHPFLPGLPRLPLRRRLKNFYVKASRPLVPQLYRRCR
jgi:hypothetical protein